MTLASADAAVALQITLQDHGYDVAVHANGAELVSAVQRRYMDLVILDLELADDSGYDVLRDLRAIAPRLPVIVLSRIADEVSRTEAFRLGADDFVPSPAPVLELLERIRLRMLTGPPPRIPYSA